VVNQTTPDAQTGKIGRALVSSCALNSHATRVSRRLVMQSALGATAMALPVSGIARAQDSATPVAATPTASSDSQIYVFPAPGSITASLGTQISFRGANLRTVQPIEVVGSKSGVHSGVALPHSDGNGISWLLDFEFHPGEEVSVETRLDIVGAVEGNFTFTACTPRLLGANAGRNKKPVEGQVHEFRSRPGLAPMVVEAVAHGEGLAPGLLFIAPKEGAGRNGALIIDERGEPVWFFPVEVPVDQILDFRVQELDGQPVLTWWQGAQVRGHGFGHWVIRDRSYEEVATIRIGNGYAGGDLHELLLTRQNTALVGAYNTIAWDLRSVDGKKDGDIIDSVVQEIDLATGAVIFEWHALDHIALEESYDKVNQEDERDAYDHFHFNSITLDEEENLVVSARNTWAAYKIDRISGEIIWRLNGNQSDFEMGPNTEMAYQHDVKEWPNGEVTLFDNGGQPQVHDESRGLVLQLDTDEMTADVAREYLHPDHIVAGSQGNVQVLPNGNVLIGWGSEPLVSEFTHEGELLCDWRMPEEKQSYRAYKFDWSGMPVDQPAIAVERGTGDEIAIYASWNGTTNVVEWQVIGGESDSDLEPIGDPLPRTGFETTLRVTSSAALVAVRALDVGGEVLGTSDASPAAD
jgi:hypothetical protein